MSDDSHSRYRSSDPYGHAPAPGGQGSDPLAELARLIGQNDPFSEFGRDSRASAPAPRYDEPAQHYDHAAPSYDQHPAPSEWNAAAPEAPGYDPFVALAHQAPDQHYGSPVYGDAHRQPEAEPYHADQGSYGAPHAAFEAPGYAQPSSDAHGFQQDFQPTSFPPQTYQHDDGHAASDEYYDDAPPESRRKGLITVVAVLGLAVVGTAGAFGYRSMFGGSHSSSAPPVFRASTEPVKIAPPPQQQANNGDASAAKLSYDRFGDRSQNEKVMVREEQPVDIKGLAERAMAPQSAAPAVSNVASTPASGPVASAPNPPSVLTEPRRVRTVQIHPDQPETAAPRQALPQPQPTNVAPQAVAPAPRQQVAAGNNAPTNLAPEPVAPHSAPHIVRTVPQRTAAVEPPSANAPMSLSPEGSNAPLPAAPQLASTRSTPRVAALASGANGHYLVQVSSQRSEADAQSAFRSLKSKFGGVLGDRQPLIRKAELGAKGTYYRAMVGPFASRADAVSLCGNLKAAGGDCVVQSN